MPESNSLSAHAFETCNDLGQIYANTSTARTEPSIYSTDTHTPDTAALPLRPITRHYVATHPLTRALDRNRLQAPAYVRERQHSWRAPGAPATILRQQPPWRTSHVAPLAHAAAPWHTLGTQEAACLKGNTRQNRKK